jgi:hypothetical protein
MQHPAAQLHQPVNLLAIDQMPFTIPQQRPHPAVAIGRVLLDELVNAIDQGRVRFYLRACLGSNRVEGRARQV